MSNFVITIDGPAASGKSTAARLLAQRLGASFLDTGAMYRAVTFAAMADGADLTSEQDLLKVVASHDFAFEVRNDLMEVGIDDRDVTKLIRGEEVTASARFIASAPKVREKLVVMQRQFAAQHKAIVTEGRDQGTVAFPDADFKFFLTAQPQERARRRTLELREKGNDENLAVVQKSLERRDKSDMERSVGPLRAAPDAIEIDTTNLDIEQVVDRLYEIVNKKHQILRN